MAAMALHARVEAMEALVAEARRDTLRQIAVGPALVLGPREGTTPSEITFAADEPMQLVAPVVPHLLPVSAQFLPPDVSGVDPDVWQTLPCQ